MTDEILRLVREYGLADGMSVSCHQNGNPDASRSWYEYGEQVYGSIELLLAGLVSGP